MVSTDFNNPHVPPVHTMADMDMPSDSKTPGFITSLTKILWTSSKRRRLENIVMNFVLLSCFHHDKVTLSCTALSVSVTSFPSKTDGDIFCIICLFITHQSTAVSAAVPKWPVIKKKKPNFYFLVQKKFQLFSKPCCWNRCIMRFSTVLLEDTWTSQKNRQPSVKMFAVCCSSGFYINLCGVKMMSSAVL